MPATKAKKKRPGKPDTKLAKLIKVRRKRRLKVVVAAPAGLEDLARAQSAVAGYSRTKLYGGGAARAR